MVFPVEYNDLDGFEYMPSENLICQEAVFRPPADGALRLWFRTGALPRLLFTSILRQETESKLYAKAF